MRESRVSKLTAEWSDDGASRGSAYMLLRDLAQELEEELATTKQKLADASAHASYYAGKLTEITRRHCDEIDVSAGLRKKLEAAQLHIKELRGALAECERHAHSMAVWGGERWTYHPPQARKIAESSCNALAKQPDTRALDKALLEARIDELGLFDSSASVMKVLEYKAKLAELNKE